MKHDPSLDARCSCGHSRLVHPPERKGGQRPSWCMVTGCKCVQYIPKNETHEDGPEVLMRRAENQGFFARRIAEVAEEARPRVRWRGGSHAENSDSGE